MPPAANRPSNPPVRFNVTPLIDVVFLLVIFFMLVSQFSSAEHVTLKSPNRTKARRPRLPSRKK